MIVATLSGTAMEVSKTTLKLNTIHRNAPTNVAPIIIDEKKSHDWFGVLVVFVIALVIAVCICGVAFYTRRKLKLKRRKMAERRKNRNIPTPFPRTLNPIVELPTDFPPRIQCTEDNVPFHTEDFSPTEVNTRQAKHCTSEVAGNSTAVGQPQRSTSDSYYQTDHKENGGQAKFEHQSNPRTPLSHQTIH
ncbi:unnamed protein product [Phytomonas sp. EM1]|nr:unnamed protein product [Phytomonas sp. EM1]|eukprot:CCW65531.1 unnamed protein product [Phytomonas sp. isolate EM1]